MPGPTEANELLRQADVALSNQDWTSAVGLYQQALADADRDVTKDSDAYWNTGYCLLQTGQVEPAKEAFAAGSFGPDQYQDLIDDARANAGISGSEDEEDGDDGQEADPSDDPAYDQAFEVACDAYSSGNYDGAAQRFEELGTSSATDDQKKEIRWNLGMCHFHLGQPDRALDQFTEGGYAESEYAPVLGDMVKSQKIDAANQAFDAGNFQDAVALFGALSQDSNLPAEDRKQVYWQLGLANFHIGDELMGRRAMGDGGFAESDYHEAFEAAAAGR